MAQTTVTNFTEAHNGLMSCSRAGQPGPSSSRFSGRGEMAEKQQTSRWRARTNNTIRPLQLGLLVSSDSYNYLGEQYQVSGRKLAVVIGIFVFRAPSRTTWVFQSGSVVIAFLILLEPCCRVVVSPYGNVVISIKQYIQWWVGLKVFEIIWLWRLTR